MKDLAWYWYSWFVLGITVGMVVSLVAHDVMALGDDPLAPGIAYCLSDPTPLDCIPKDTVITVRGK